TGNEMALMAQFLRNPDTVFSCRRLAKAALGYEVSEREAAEIIRPHISRLRRKVEPNPAKPRVIRTIRGKVYLYSPS
ncbi:MAG: winged helix-turn-helix domain-containing protein, partial [Anaerolineae bacterium]